MYGGTAWAFLEGTAERRARADDLAERVQLRMDRDEDTEAIYYNVWARVPDEVRLPLADRTNELRRALLQHVRDLDRPEAVKALEAYDESFLTLSMTVARRAFDLGGADHPFPATEGP